jgi:hypothetical protein
MKPNLQLVHLFYIILSCRYRSGYKTGNTKSKYEHYVIQKLDFFSTTPSLLS